MADLSYTLGLDAGNFLGMGSRVISVMGSMELAVQGIQRAASAMASAFSAAADMEQVTTAIGTITKSATTTAQIMADLKADAASTPFELSDLAPAARALLGAGTQAGGLSKQLRMLGDISSGAGTDLQGLVSVFNQVRGKGKLSAEEFQQFAERGVAGLREEIAKFKGISLDSVGDSLSAGAVSAKDLETVFQRMTGTGGIFFQAMERQSETFTGKLSTLGDAWTGLQIAFAAPINDALKPIIEDAGSLMETLTPAFEAIGQQVATSLGSLRDFVLQLESGSGVVEAMVSSFGDLGAMLLEFVSIPIGAIMDALPVLGVGLMLALQPAAEWFGAKMEQIISSVASTLQDVLQGAVREIEALPRDMTMNLVYGDLRDLTSEASDNEVKNNSFFPDFAGRAKKREESEGRGLTSYEDKAKAAGEKASSVDSSAMLEKSFSLLSEGMSEILEGMAARLAAFQSGTPYSATDGADIGRTIADSFIERLADAAGAQTERGNVNNANTATSAAATDSSAAINKLESILNELQRINTQ